MRCTLFEPAHSRPAAASASARVRAPPTCAGLGLGAVSARRPRLHRDGCAVRGGLGGAAALARGGGGAAGLRRRGEEPGTGVRPEKEKEKAEAEKT